MKIELLASMLGYLASKLALTWSTSVVPSIHEGPREMAPLCNSLLRDKPKLFIMYIDNVDLSLWVRSLLPTEAFFHFSKSVNNRCLQQDFWRFSSTDTKTDSTLKFVRNPEFAQIKNLLVVTRCVRYGCMKIKFDIQLLYPLL